MNQEKLVEDSGLCCSASHQKYHVSMVRLTQQLMLICQPRSSQVAFIYFPVNLQFNLLLIAKEGFFHNVLNNDNRKKVIIEKNIVRDWGGVGAEESQGEKSQLISSLYRKM